MLQLRSVAARLSKEMQNVASIDVPVEHLIPYIPTSFPEFDEAWQKLSLLPRPCMEKLDLVRYQARGVQQALQNISIPPSPSSPTADQLKELNELKVTLRKIIAVTGGGLDDACRELESSLKHEMKHLRKGER
jgi:hypothetical protein